MDQLFAAFGVNWKLLLAQGVNFGIVLLGLWYFLYTPVITTLEARRKLVAKGVEDAQKAERELAGADAAAAERVSKAESEAEDIVLKARKAANEERAAIVSAAQTRAGDLENDAKARAAEEAAQALRASEKEIARLAILAAEKVMREKAA